jgi:hypothetical protein
LFAALIEESPMAVRNSLAILALLSLSAALGTETQGSSVIIATDGISRLTTWGPEDFSEPPYIVSQDYSSTVNELSDNVDPRYPAGETRDEILLFDLRSMGGFVTNPTSIRFQIDEVRRNGMWENWLGADLEIAVRGSSDASLGPEDFQEGPATGYYDFSIEAGLYPHSYTVDIDLTNTLQTLLDEGFEYAMIQLDSPASDIQGPVMVHFKSTPNLVVGFDAIPAAVPEPSSVTLVGLALASAACLARLPRRAKPFARADQAG